VGSQRYFVLKIELETNNNNNNSWDSVKETQSEQVRFNKNSSHNKWETRSEKVGYSIGNEMKCE